MDAVIWHAPNNLEISQLEIPKRKSEDEILVKVKFCGICGSDKLIAEGGFHTVFPLIPGHEIVGVVADIGAEVEHVAVGDRVVIDPTIIDCKKCFYCSRGNKIMCQNFQGIGLTRPGGFSNYVVAQSHKVFKLPPTISDIEATLIEPTSCCVHAIDRLGPTVAGIDALVLGAGANGQIIAQLLKVNGAIKVVLAANKGAKTTMAKQIRSADLVVELDRENPELQWQQLNQDYPNGFDVVVDATGSAEVATQAIHHVRKGGTLLLYSTYKIKSMVQWPPLKIFGDEIKILGSFIQADCFPRAIAYLESGKVNVKGMVTDIFSIKDFRKALEKVGSKEAVKTVVQAE